MQLWCLLKREGSVEKHPIRLQGFTLGSLRKVVADADAMGIPDDAVFRAEDWGGRNVASTLDPPSYGSPIAPTFEFFWTKPTA